MIGRALAVGAAALVLWMGHAATAAAGGWASVTLDKPIGEPRAGEAISVSFLVKQHGNTPIHEAFGQPVTPLFVARDLERRESIEFAAKRSKAVGYFTADVVFPRPGAWSVEIIPQPFAGTSLGTVNVLTAAGARLTSAADEAAIVRTAPAQATAPASHGATKDTVAALALLGLAVLGVVALVWRPGRLAGRAGR